MLIKKGQDLKDPNLDRNQKHTTPNEIMNETEKRKKKKYKITKTWSFGYEEGQYEEIFKK